MQRQSPTFDSTDAVRFDLASGAIRAKHHDEERLVLVPSSALDEVILSASVQAVDALARSIGSAIGRRAAARMEAGAASSVELFATQLSGEAALSGVGSLSFERWGRVMVVVIDNSPLPTPLLAPLVAAALEASAGRTVWCTLLVRDAGAARLLVSSEGAVARARAAIAAGTPWGEVLALLQGARS
jgi:hypothetical protein